MEVSTRCSPGGQDELDSRRIAKAEQDEGDLVTVTGGDDGPDLIDDQNSGD
jgi:hypothetical protein